MSLDFVWGKLKCLWIAWIHWNIEIVKWWRGEEVKWCIIIIIVRFKEKRLMLTWLSFVLIFENIHPNCTPYTYLRSVFSHILWISSHIHKISIHTITIFALFSKYQQERWVNTGLVNSFSFNIPLEPHLNALIVYNSPKSLLALSFTLVYFYFHFIFDAWCSMHDQIPGENAFPNFTFRDL